MHKLLAESNIRAAITLALAEVVLHKKPVEEWNDVVYDAVTKPELRASFEVLYGGS